MYKIYFFGKCGVCYDNLCVYWLRVIIWEISIDIIYLFIGCILWIMDCCCVYLMNFNIVFGGENFYLIEGFNWCKICY